MNMEKRDITTVVEKELPLYVRNVLWYILEQWREYHEESHCFELDAAVNEDGKPMQKIVHTCHPQVYQQEHRHHIETPVKASVVIKIKGSDAQIMMLANEPDIRK